MRDPDTEGHDSAADVVPDAERRAEQLLLRLSAATDVDAQAEYQGLLDSIRDLAPRFAFDRDGRPAAIAAVRDALPLMERDLFDAIVEDYTCELAAAREAVRQVARASGRRPG